MVFRRSDLELQKDATFSGTLEELGFRLNLEGQVVTRLPPYDFYEFAKYEKHETNQQRYHAIHKAVRASVHETLAEVGVKARYLYMSDNGDEHHLTTTKPAEPSIKILVSRQISVLERKEIYLVVGDSKQDLAIWSRKAIMTESGITHGSVIRLVSELRSRKMSTGGPGVPDDDAAQKVAEKQATRPSEFDLPGIIILNPGELLYSHKQQDCMSPATWQDQEREHAFSDQYKITEAYNTVKGHKTSGEHIETFLREFIGDLMGPKTHLNIIAVGDASEAVLGFLNKAYTLAEAGDELNKDFRFTIALVQPTHDANIVTDRKLQDVLAKHGRAWESHSEPQGTLLKRVAPGMMFPPPPLTETALQSLKQEVMSKSERDEDEASKEQELGNDSTTREDHGLKRETPSEVLKDEKGENQYGSASGTASNDPNAYPYYKQHVNCPTFSAGIEDTTDMVVPHIMDEVLRFFKEDKESRKKAE